MIVFVIAGIVLVLSAIFVVTAQKAVYSVIGLLVHFVALASLYVTLSAEFLGVIQMIVYAGAVLILFLFVIALLSSGVAPFREGPNRLPAIAVPAVVAIAIFFGLVLYSISRMHGLANVSSAAAGVAPVGAANAFGSVNDFGRALLTTNLLPFEITAFILLVAIVGVILLVRDATPYSPSTRRKRVAERNEREAVLREGRHV